MKRTILLFLGIVMLGLNPVNAQKNHLPKTGNDRFSIKIQPFMGGYLDPSGNIGNGAKNSW